MKHEDPFMLAAVALVCIGLGIFLGMALSVWGVG